MNIPNNQQLTLRKAHELVRDLMTPIPWIYWLDFIFHISLGWVTFFVALNESESFVFQFFIYIVSTLSLYRAATFIHELTHFKKNTFKLFRLVWNLTCGIPLLIPSFTYDGTHNNHHKLDVYGTDQDGEYLPFAHKKPIEMILYLLLSFILPAILIIRFLFLVPLSYLIPSLRKILWERLSALIINPNYKRQKDSIRHDKNWQIQEFSAFIFSATVLICIMLNILDYKILILWYAIGMIIVFLNALRTLSAHAYRNPNGQKMNFIEQYLDSVDINNNSLISELWAPIGLRYHATHHLFMNLPYHNLAEAQRRLVNGLGDSLLSSITKRDDLSDALQNIWREASTHALNANRGKYNINQELKANKLRMGTAIVGVLYNPLSGSYKKQNATFVNFCKTIPGLIIKDAKDSSGFETSINTLLCSKIDVLIIIGGDGTTQAALTCLLKLCPLTEWPILSIVSSGTTNMTASDITSHHDIKKSLLGLSRVLLNKTSPLFTERHLLCIKQVGQAQKCGMFFSIGLIARIVIFSRGRIKNIKLNGEIYSAISALFYFFGTTYNHYFTKTLKKKISISLEEKKFESDTSQLLFVSSLDRLLFGMRPYWGKEKHPLHVTFTTGESKKLLRMALKIIFRPKSIDAKELGYLSFNVNKIELLLDEPYILDGEPYQVKAQDGPLCIEGIGPTTFLVW